MLQKIQGNINEYIGSKIRTIRIEKGWDQGDLADKLAISNSSFCKIEHGYIDINVHRLNQIASVLEVATEQLLPETLGDKKARLEKKLNECDIYIQSLHKTIDELTLRLQKDGGS